MSNKSIRIRTKTNEDKNIQVKIEQDFDFLEVLSLKINQEDVYNTFCSDYGVVVGRVIANKGFGVPNAKVSVFIPISSDDEKNDLIKDLYPFKTSTSKDKNQTRYNLLLNETTCTLNKAVGTFPTKEDLLNNDVLIEIYEKYYKYTTKTNDSGDYLIFGVPTGQQTIHMDVDLSDVGIFSVRPYDLIDSGYPIELFDGRKEFKTSSNLDSLPQIKSGNKGVNVLPFWGDDEKCQIGITRVDFDTNFDFKPTSVMVGSIFTDNGKNSLNKNCKPRNKQGRHGELRTGPGILESIRVDDYSYETYIDSDGEEKTRVKPLSLEKFVLPQGVDSVDSDGSFAVTVPMNLDHVITNEEGDLVPSNDPDVGVPTNGMYRFKLNFSEGSGSPKRKTGQIIFPALNRNTGGSKIDIEANGLNNNTENARWSDNIAVWKDPSNGDFIDDNIYKDFHDFEFNQIYTISQYITKYKKGGNRYSFLGLKGVDESTFNPMPFTTIVKKFDILYIILKLVLRLQASLMKLLILLANLSFVICLKLGFRAFGRNITILELKIPPFRPFGFAKFFVPNGGLILSCESDTSFPKKIEDWACDDSVPKCSGRPPYFKFLVYIPSDTTSDEGFIRTFKCDKYILVDRWLCCSIYDLAVQREVIKLTFTDSWLTGSMYLPQFKEKNDKYCGPGTDNKGGDKYEDNKCPNRGGGGFTAGEKSVVRGYTKSKHGNTYHKNNYKTGATDTKGFIYTPEMYPTKIVNLGRTDSCPDIIDRVNKCIDSTECLIDLFMTSNCSTSDNIPNNCLMGTYYSEGTDTSQWVNDMESTTYQNPSQVILKQIKNCSSGIDGLFDKCGGLSLSNECDECEVDVARKFIKTTSRLYADIVLTDEDVNTGLIEFKWFENDMGQVQKFSNSLYDGNDGDPMTYVNDDKLGSGTNHLGNVPYFYFGLIAGSTALDKLRTLYLSEKKED